MNDIAAASANLDESEESLSLPVISLLKNVVYQEEAPETWRLILKLKAQLQDYLKVIGLELDVREPEGFAFVRSSPVVEDSDGTRIPRLVPRRSLSFPVSLLLVLFRKRMIDFDKRGGETRLVLTRDEIVEMMRIYLPETSNQVKLVDQLESHLKRIIDFGYLRPLKSTTGNRGETTYEVRPILKAFVDAQWLSDFDTRLASYQTAFGIVSEGEENE